MTEEHSIPSSMSQTFNCPHCDAKYPIKAALIGRNVRCTSCKNAFQLQENGIARKITGRNDQARQKARDDDTKRQAIKERMRTTHDRVSEQEQDKQARQKEADAKRQRLRQAMAATLNQSASQALETEASKEETKRYQRRRAEQRKKVENEKSVSQLEVVLTRHGEQEQQQRRVWTMGCAALLLFIASAIYLVRGQSELEAALSHFVEVPPAQQRSYAKRLAYYLDKMWFYGILDQGNNAIIVDVDKAELDSNIIRIDCSGAVNFIKQFDGMVHMHTEEHWQANELEIAEREALLEVDPDQFNAVRPLPDLWVQKDAQEFARASWWENGGTLRSDLLLRGKLEASGKLAMLSREIPKRARQMIKDELAAHIIAHMFIAYTDADGNCFWQDQMLNGSIPNYVDICHFRGVGTLLHDKGESADFINDIPYRGFLMRTDLLAAHNETAGAWRIFEIKRINK